MRGLYPRAPLQEAVARAVRRLGLVPELATRLDGRARRATNCDKSLTSINKLDAAHVSGSPHHMAMLRRLETVE